MRIDSSLLFTLGKLVDFLDRGYDGLYILANAEIIHVTLDEFKKEIVQYTNENNIGIYEQETLNTDENLKGGYYFTLYKRISMDDQNPVDYVLTNTFKYVQIVFEEDKQKYGIRSEIVKHLKGMGHKMKGNFTEILLNDITATDVYIDNLTTLREKTKHGYVLHEMINDLKEKFRLYS